MYIQMTPEQYDLMIAKVEYDLTQKEPIIIAYTKTSDSSFDVQTIDAWVSYRYDVAAHRLYGDVGKRLSLAAVVASADQIFAFTVEVMFMLPDVPAPVNKPIEKPEVPAGDGSLKDKLTGKPPDNTIPEKPPVIDNKPPASGSGDGGIKPPHIDNKPPDSKPPVGDRPPHIDNKPPEKPEKPPEPAPKGRFGR